VGTRDERVIQDDRKNFTGVAEIIDSNERNCMDELAKFLHARKK
jgi:hypothetical protein